MLQKICNVIQKIFNYDYQKRGRNSVRVEKIFAKRLLFFSIASLIYFDMNDKHKANIDFKNNIACVKANIVLFSFKENKTYIIYSPHLEVSGYGNTDEEAMRSFQLCLEEFFNYSINKKTLHKELIALGWKVKKGSENNPPKIETPSWDVLMKRDSYFSDMLNTQTMKSMPQEILIPA